MSKVLVALILLATLAADGLPGLGVDKQPVPSRTWFGTILNLELRSVAPPGRVLTEPAAFEKLWKAWKPADLVPAVDFTKHVILVETHGSRKIDRFHLRLSKEGDLRVEVAFSDHKDFPGFTFGMAQVSRAGIRSIAGKGLNEPPRP
jgi:hypothetical protein